METELLSLQQAAGFLSVSKSTMYRLADQGKVCGMKAGKQWRFQKRHLAEYLKRGPAALALGNLPIELLNAQLDTLGSKIRDAGGVYEKSNGANEAAKIAQIVRQTALLMRLKSASDLHLERRGEEFFQMRFRIDGALVEIHRFPIALGEPILRQWKTFAGLQETRKQSQTGNFQMRLGEVRQPFQVSIVPTFSGERLVVRALFSEIPSLDELGFHDSPLKTWIKRPTGLILFAGGPISGKTTTLFACAKEACSDSVNVLSLQDPSGYLTDDIPQVHLENGSRADAFKSLLQQDPDIIVVGSIDGDEELQALVMLAAQTGHLVLATTEAPHAVTPSMTYAEVLIGVVHQRLVKRLCDRCKELNDDTFYEPRGCEACHGSGYRGMLPIQEYLEMTNILKKACLSGATEQEILALALEAGFLTSTFKMRQMATRGEIFCGDIQFL